MIVDPSWASAWVLHDGIDSVFFHVHKLGLLFPSLLQAFDSPALLNPVFYFSSIIDGVSTQSVSQAHREH